MPVEAPDLPAAASQYAAILAKIAGSPPVLDCLQIHRGMPSDLYERIAAQPSHEISQRIISGKLFPHGMDPGASFPPQHRCNLSAGEQPDLVAVHILDR
jgi:hypothetical protein